MILFLSLSTVAEGTTSADVLRAVEDMTAEVRLLHEANLSPASGMKMSRSQTLHPRHVLQLVRSVQQKANTLAWLNGAETLRIGPLPTRTVNSADVLARVEAIAWIIDGVKPIFRVRSEINRAPRREGVTPNDVYASLHQLSQMIDGLGTPRTVPNDIYVTADVIVSELDILARNYLETHRLGAHYITSYYTTWNAGQRPKRKAKSLTDVYHGTFALADGLDRLIAMRPELAPAGGIIRPYRRRGAVSADHVSYALNDVLADIVAMKATTGDQTRTQSIQAASGVTPTQVFDRLQDALTIIKALTAKG